MSLDKTEHLNNDLPLSRVDLPPDRAPNGRVPVGVRPLSVSTLSLSSRKVVNTFAILPIARILFRIISLRATTPAINTKNVLIIKFQNLTFFKLF